MDQRPVLPAALAGLAGFMPSTIPLGLGGVGAAADGSVQPRFNRDGTDEMISTIESNIYHDNSKLTPADIETALRSRRVSARKDPTFPMKLHRLLADPEAEGIISWLPHGRSWKIIKPEKLETVLLPRYYNHSNSTSFMRQVNGWDFRRVANGTDQHSYYHELFLRGMPQLSKLMVRGKKSKKNGGVQRLLSITPDFYRMDPLPSSIGPDGASASPSDPAAAAAKADGQFVASSTEGGDKKKDSDDDQDGSASKFPAQQSFAAPAVSNITAAMPQPFPLLNPALIAQPSPAVAAASATGASNLQLLQAQDIQAKIALLNTMRMMGGQPTVLLPFGGSMAPLPATPPGGAGAGAPSLNLNDPSISAMFQELARSNSQQMP
mmetsp:Transcript_16891/g.36738  ORF Transcript_16891/g.36738 Transcript_16891/m.36738 type:complete len:379 (+) Transcript_16891:154-1290(+)